MNISKGNLNCQKKKKKIGQLPLVHSEVHWTDIITRHEIDLVLLHYKQMFTQMDICFVVSKKRIRKKCKVQSEI